MLKHIFIFFFAITCLLATASAQDATLKFYDSSWIPTSKESAYYVSQQTKLGDIYLSKTYWVNSQKLQAVSTGLDTLHYGKKIGLTIRYYENGLTKDSMMYKGEGELVYSYGFHENGKLSSAVYYGVEGEDSARHYYKSGVLRAYYLNDQTNKKEIIHGYEENGAEIKNFIYQVEASFIGGADAWKKFLIKNLNPNTPVKNKAPAGIYMTVARFVINTDGSVSDIKMETDFGYGMEKEVLRMLKRSPKWSPAIQFNHPVKAYRRQPVTFMVSDN